MRDSRCARIGDLLRAQVRHRTITDCRHIAIKSTTVWAASCADTPAPGQTPPAARIGAAHWQDYFPARHKVSGQYFRLTASFVDTYSFDTAQWRAQDLHSE